MPDAPALPSDQRYQATRRVTLVGALTNVALAAAQLLGGLLTHSQGLIADGLHTLSDLASDFVVLFAAKHARHEADAEHPYGHGRIETLATSLLGLALISVAVGIGFNLVERMLHPERLTQPTPAAIGFALLAVFSKEGLYRYTMAVARRVRSDMLRANAWHHRSDAISSLVVVAGIVGSLLGIANFDAVAALIVCLFIAHIGWQLLWQSSQELIDSALDPATVRRIEEIIRSVDGVVAMHQLRTRKSGSCAFVDVHIQVPERVSVSEGHQISEAVRARLLQEVEPVTDVTIHIDPEDDLVARPSDGLPLRHELLAALAPDWRALGVAEQIHDVRLHYLDGCIHLELVLPLALCGDAELQAALRERGLAHPAVCEVRILFGE